MIGFLPDSRRSTEGAPAMQDTFRRSVTGARLADAGHEPGRVDGPVQRSWGRCSKISRAGKQHRRDRAPNHRASVTGIMLSQRLGPSCEPAAPAERHCRPSGRRSAGSLAGPMGAMREFRAGAARINAPWARCSKFCQARKQYPDASRRHPASRGQDVHPVPEARFYGTCIVLQFARSRRTGPGCTSWPLTEGGLFHENRGQRKQYPAPSKREGCSAKIVAGENNTRSHRACCGRAGTRASNFTGNNTVDRRPPARARVRAGRREG